LDILLLNKKKINIEKIVIKEPIALIAFQPATASG
jgi:hypothetical protein